MMIVLDGVEKYFGQLHVLKNINLTVGTGEKVVVIGPSGSGKSTLIRCMNLLEKPTSGAITVDGVDITEPNAPIRKIRESVAMVFQQFNLFNNMTVLENCMVGQVKVLKVDEKTARETAQRHSAAGPGAPASGSCPGGRVCRSAPPGRRRAPAWGRGGQSARRHH